MAASDRERVDLFVASKALGLNPVHRVAGPPAPVAFSTISLNMPERKGAKIIMTGWPRAALHRGFRAWRLLKEKRPVEGSMRANAEGWPA